MYCHYSMEIEFYRPPKKYYYLGYSNLRNAACLSTKEEAEKFRTIIHWVEADIKEDMSPEFKQTINIPIRGKLKGDRFDLMDLSTGVFVYTNIDLNYLKASHIENIKEPLICPLNT